MKKIKTGLVLSILLPLSSLVLVGIIFAQSPLEGKVIALDAGHGGIYDGAVNQKYQVAEKDVNIDVVYALKAQLEGENCVVLTREGDETILSRKTRVVIAAEKCADKCGGECDVLVSVHHNANLDPEHDGTLTIYNERQDVPLAIALHDALIAGFGLPDEEYLHGGYGITVFDHMVSSLTEAYYITNDWEAEQYLSGNRVNEEADALYQGLANFFSSFDNGITGKNKK